MKIGIVGFRGMVGSVLIERMKEMEDFDSSHDWWFYSTTMRGEEGPLGERILDANDPGMFKYCDIIVTCQGSQWTEKMYPEIRKSGWDGIWLDTSAAFRLNEDSIIVLDPVNKDAITRGASKGIKIFSGGNCTVSLMLMAIRSLFNEGSVEWVSANTYQAASGAGSKHMEELIGQMRYISDSAANARPADNALEIDRLATEGMLSENFPKSNFGVPLAGSLIPWIGDLSMCGITEEEWKSHYETNKILGNNSQENEIAIDSTCVRVGAMRCHSQALLIAFKERISEDEVINTIKSFNDWVKIIPNKKKETINNLTPAAVAGQLNIVVGRIRRSRINPNYFHLFTVGDQLLWGAAEPTRRALKLICDSI